MTAAPCTPAVEERLRGLAERYRIEVMRGREERLARFARGEEPLGRADDANELRDAAWRYLPRVVPLRPGSKVPALPDWPRRPLTTVAEVDAYWGACPTANVGILCGAGLVVIDVDPRHSGTVTLAALPALPATREAITGRDGRHLYFAGPPDLPSFDLGRGVEVKSNGRQVVAPPSVHPETGRLYVWHPARHPDVMPEAPLPDWVVEAAGGTRVRETERDARESGAVTRRDEATGKIYDALTGDYLGTDPLIAIPPRVYVERLLGVPVPPSGKVRCPFGGHERGDREPSLHVYRVRGWFCFGCRRGGTIIDLGAAVAGVELPLPKRQFRKLCDRLRQLFAAELAT